MTIFSKKIAIDLGTANSLVYEVGRGIVLNEPTVVAVTADGGKVVAIGKAAKEMLGRAPQSIKANRPLKDGVIADYATTEALMRFFIDEVCGSKRFVRPEVMVSVPAGVTSVESRAVLDATISGGAKNAYLIPEPLAAAIGAEIPISEPRGSMVINAGGGTTEVAIISLGGIVAQGSVRVAGNRIDEAIIEHLRREHNLVVGEQTAEALKIKIGSALPLPENPEREVKGRDSISGLPRVVRVTSNEVTVALERPLQEIISQIKSVLEKTPPELASDVIDKGMVLTGGTSLLRNMSKIITRSTGVPSHIADQPLRCVVRGCAQAIKNLEVFKKNLTSR